MIEQTISIERIEDVIDISFVYPLYFVNSQVKKFFYFVIHLYPPN